PVRWSVINTNGLGDVMKTTAVQNAIIALRPNAWVLNETKSASDVGSRIPVKGYKLHESHGVRADGKGRSAKWGVIVGIESSLHAQRVEVDPSLQGRAVVLDVIIPTSDGSGFDSSDECRSFWSQITQLCRDALYSWSVAGDCNATTSSAESTGETYRITPARQQYIQFLQAADGHDLWMDQPDRNACDTLTYKGPFGQSIIDRVAHSRRGILEGTITVNNTPSYNPRSIYPKKHEKHRFQMFSQKLDPWVSAPVTDEVTWTSRYEALTQIFDDAARNAFEYPKTYAAPTQKKIINPMIKILVIESRRVNRLIHAISSQYIRTPRCMFEFWVANYVNAYYSVLQTPSGENMTFPQYLKSIRRALAKLRYHEEKAELLRRQDITTKSRINSAPLGGSTKKLFSAAVYDPPPLALSLSNDPTSFVTSPEGIKTATREYFTSLFRRHPHPLAEKSWMTTPSVLEIKRKTGDDPFVWPNPLSVTTLRGVLRKGTPHPCPGPDGEKWWLKALSDPALNLVLDLINFEITKSCFPAAVKPTIMATIHKRGARTQLSNTRGICFSNQLIETWSNRGKMPVFALKRDQQKGFDHLEPQVFYDAVEAYGLPRALIDFDRAAQADVP
ncbi:hypothetical protein B0H13DRAFT_1506417, partial [Mycena leptocephala]